MSGWLSRFSPKIKRFTAVCVVCAGAMGFIAAGLSFSERTAVHKKDQTVKNVLMDRNTREVSIDAMEADLKRLSRENRELGRQISALQSRLDRQSYAGPAGADPRETDEKIARLSKKIEDLTAVYRELLSQRTSSSLSSPPSSVSSSELSSGSEENMNSSEGTLRENPELFLTSPAGSGAIRVFSQPEKETKSGKEKGNKEGKSSRGIVLPAGSILSGVFLNGMDAPTGHGSGRQQFPALLKISREAILPNNYRSDIRDCFLIVSGYGDLSSQRAYLRGEVLSCITTRKEILEGRLDSYVVGPDGHAGIRGRLVSKQGQAIARSLMAGFMSGLSKAFDVNAVPTISTSSSGTVSYEKVYSSDALRGSAASGISSSLDRIAGFYLEMAEGIFPVIEIDAGRKASVIVSRGTRLKVTNLKDYQGTFGSSPKEKKNSGDDARLSFFENRKKRNDK